jgi:acyl-CoA thioesterase I
MNKVVIILSLIILGITIFFVTRDSGPDVQTKEGPVIVFGDSLVYGIGSTPGNDLVSQLERRLNIDIINAGVPGDTTEDAKNRLVANVILKEPSIVVVIVGGNDVLRRLPKEQTLQNVRYIVSEIQKTGAKVVLVGVSRLAYSGDYKKIANEFNTEFIPNLLDKTLANKELMSDSVHPNDKGYAIFADEIASVVQKILP